MAEVTMNVRLLAHTKLSEEFNEYLWLRDDDSDREEYRKGVRC
ncbi:hypothetical protein [Aneurinibacillus aneurinilyticus]|nr:hypothetical protein [Aneurinibacillus aneurinilyticus]